MIRRFLSSFPAAGQDIGSPAEYFAGAFRDQD
jgi:hypothetical protein